MPPAADDLPRTPYFTGTMRNTNSTRLRAAGILVVGAALAATLTGCAALDSIDSGTIGMSESEASFGDYSAASDSREAIRIPDLVPEDATDIRMKWHNVDFGSLIAFESAEGITADYCEPGEVSGDPGLEAGWWPEDVPAEGLTCGFWTAFESEGVYYAWDTRA